MKREQVAELIHDAVRGVRASSTGWVRVNCPICETRKGSADDRHSLGFKLSSGGFRCFRCNVAGRAPFEGLVIEEAKDDETPRPIIPRDDFVQLWTEEGWSSEGLEEPRTFMLRRGFSRRHLAQGNVHAAIAGRYHGRVIVPHVDERGDWWGFTARRWYEGDSPKVLYPANMPRKMFNEHVLFVETHEPVMVVEGCLDALWYLPHVVAALGKPTQAHFETLTQARRPIVVCLDGDAWEEGRALAQRLRLRGKQATFVRLPADQDPNTVDPDWLRREVAHAGTPCTSSSHSPQ